MVIHGLGSIIRTFRTSIGMSQEEFARASGLTGRSVSRYETGEPISKLALLKIHNFAMNGSHEKFAALMSGALSVRAIADSNEALLQFTSNVKELADLVEELLDFADKSADPKLLTLVGRALSLCRRFEQMTKLLDIGEGDLDRASGGVE